HPPGLSRRLLPPQHLRQVERARFQSHRGGYPHRDRPRGELERARTRWTDGRARRHLPGVGRRPAHGGPLPRSGAGARLALLAHAHEQAPRGAPGVPDAARAGAGVGPRHVGRCSVTPATRATRVVLTGFMGTGKTEVGGRLGRRLGWPFVDTDTLVESAAGPPGGGPSPRRTE